MTWEKQQKKVKHRKSSEEPYIKKKTVVGQINVGRGNKRAT